MSEVFGFDEAASDFDVLESKSNNAKKVMHEMIDDITEDARSIFQSTLGQHTGQGASGIQNEKTDTDATGGWAGRPGLHGYFHEIGTYKDPAKPHYRPAFDKHAGDYVEKVQREIT